eukprot:CAMPEP_0168181232 /NCGR_PEP_ID=MMETSP0139_2-20121125/11081_1 /TAXON_ID=44445 /ORGANISM="Pseudo-nitzschia australis, Strain 10249 10 AB" /LENGTH=325 /DNA_ID=CAMNT_0008101743 /DNA_START=162 /DNA_END=1136 /DNA_ORIENTATION=-
MITATANKDESAQQPQPGPHQPQQKQRQIHSSLALLSSIAIMISDGHNEYELEDCLDRVRDDAVAKARVNASAAPITSAVNANANANDDGQQGEPKKNMGGLSRSLSRMNLSYLDTNTVASSSYQQQQHPQHQQQKKSTSTPTIGSCAVTSSTVVVAQRHTTIPNTHISSPMILQNYNYNYNHNNNVDVDAEMLIATTTSAAAAAAATASKGPLATPPTIKTTASPTATLYTPSDDIIKNVYRSYEMHLPESSTHTAGRILPIYCCGKNNKDDKIDDYNNDVLDDYNNDIMVTECYSPLRNPPRLPDPRESSSIAERSREERNNW